eukprot:11892540-Prorocentrum_lima.AAC.1
MQKLELKIRGRERLKEGNITRKQARMVLLMTKAMVFVPVVVMPLMCSGRARVRSRDLPCHRAVVVIAWAMARRR